MFPIRDTVPSKNLPVATWIIILVNGVVFLFELGMPVPVFFIPRQFLRLAPPEPAGILLQFLFAKPKGTFRRLSRDEYQTENAWVPIGYWKGFRP